MSWFRRAARRFGRIVSRRRRRSRFATWDANNRRVGRLSRSRRRRRYY